MKETPLHKLNEKYHTFGANKIYDYPITPDFWTCVDQLMLHSCIPWVMENWVGKPDAPVMFVPRQIPLPGANRLNVVVASHFSSDPNREVVIGGTVTYVNLQLAFYMGFEKALLVGMDHHYPGAEKGGKPGSKFIAQGEDPDHFSTDYFKSGRIYNRPELDAVARYTYPKAKAVWENSGRQIINVSEETRYLDVFPIEDVEKYL